MASEEAARRSEEAANRSALAAGRSEDRMRQFVADASHELRTPLTAIRGFAEYYRQRGGVASSTEAGTAGPAADDAFSDGAAVASADHRVTPDSSNGSVSSTGGLPTGPLNRQSWTGSSAR
jgi:signal transduction histidine kinase